MRFQITVSDVLPVKILQSIASLGDPVHPQPVGQEPLLVDGWKYGGSL